MPLGRGVDRSPQWVLDIQANCAKAGVAFFFKQWGGGNKKATGRMLRGRTYDEMPRTAEPVQMQTRELRVLGATSYGSGRSSTARSTLNIAVFTPTPTARVKTAIAVNPGLRRRARHPYRKSRANASSGVHPHGPRTIDLAIP